MFHLKRTLARSTFKKMLGQANHFLITILVGLNGVRSGNVHLEEEFRTSWNPQNVVRSADRSRQFALDLALVRAIDALDTYMMWARRRPCALSNLEFISKIDGAGNSVYKRLEAFEFYLPGLSDFQLELLKLGIFWRNSRVHSLSEAELTKNEKNILSDNSAKICEEYSGLDVMELISHVISGDSPTFKECASLIHLTHKTVSHFDSVILNNMNVEKYILESIYYLISKSDKLKPESALKHGCNLIWREHNSAPKVLHILQLIGVHKSTSVSGREVSDRFIDFLLNLSSEDAFLLLKDPDSLHDHYN